MILFRSYFENKTKTFCVYTRVLVACAQPCMGTWKPQVGTEYPLSLFVFKIGTFTEPGGQQLGLMTDWQAPGIVLFPRDSIWLTLSHLDFSHTVGDVNLGPQAYLGGAFPMDL